VQTQRRSFLPLVVGCLLISLISGCSVFMAAKQPDKKNLAVLNPGTPRDYVIGELDVPLHTEERNGQKTDIFHFTQGYSPSAKLGRATFHIAADIGTHMLWEFAGTAIEYTATGTEVAIKVNYDEFDRVENIDAIKGEEIVFPPERTSWVKKLSTLPRFKRSTEEVAQVE